MNSKLLQDAFSMLLEGVGDEFPNMDKAPARAAKALMELLDGYAADIDALFVVEEDEGKDQIVIARNIPFASICRHHLLVFSGMAHIAYLPEDRVIGVSKLGRLVLAFAHRLQLQEHLCKQVAYTLMEKLQPHGVAVVIVGEHACMRYRGVGLRESQMVTSEMLGVFRTNPMLRHEVLALMGIDKCM